MNWTEAHLLGDLEAMEKSEMTDLIKRDDATDAAMKAACDWVNGDTANPDEGVSFAIQAAITALPAVTVVNAPEYLCTFPQCGCVAKGQWCPVPCTAIRKAALLDAGYDTPAIDPAAIREAALRDAGYDTTLTDRIEELVEERNYTEGTNDTLIALNQALTAKLAKAVEWFKKLDRRGDALETFDPVVHEVVTAALAELEGKE